MTRQRSRKAQVAARVRGVVAAVALAAMALHVVAGAAAQHIHDIHETEETEDEACSLCAAFASEDDAILPRAAERLAAPGAEPAAAALPTLLTARSPLPYLPRGPPKLCR